MEIDEGMEALLDFADFGPVELPSDDPPTSKTLPIAVDPVEVPARDEIEPSVTITQSDSEIIVVVKSEEVVEITAPPPAKKKKRPNESAVLTDAEAASTQRSSTGIAKKKKKTPSKPVLADDGSSGRGNLNSDEEDMDGLLDGEDFEGDMMDRLPLKAEDPEDVAERQKLQLLISHLSEEQLNRYEVYRRASFPKASVRRIVQTVGGCTVSQAAVIAMAGIAKMHVGELVEAALDVKEEWGETGAVQPKHLREASRRLRNKGTTPSKYHKKTSTCPYP